MLSNISLLRAKPKSPNAVTKNSLLIKIFNTISIVIVWAINLNAQIAVIPFELVDDQIYLEVTINQFNEPRVFLFDTGATADLLDSSIANKLGLRPDDTQEVSGSSGTDSYDIIFNQKLTLADNIIIDNTHLILTDLSELNEGEEKIYEGIIGYSLVNKFITKIDFVNKEILLFNKISNVTTANYEAIPFEFINETTIPQFDISVTLRNGDHFRDKILFDSGAGLTLLINTPYNEINKLSDRAHKKLTREATNLYGKTMFETIPVKSIEVGGFTLSEMVITVAHDKTGVSSWEGYLGILGGDVISRFDVILDYSAHILYLKPNKNFSNPFEFPLSGIQLKKVDNVIKIGHVDMTCSAYNKGIRKGDRLVSINKNYLGSLSMYRNLLKRESEIVHLLIMNDKGELREVSIALNRLL